MSFRLAIVGTGLKAQEYADAWLNNAEITIPAIVDVGFESRAAFAKLCVKKERQQPEEHESIEQLLAAQRGQLDAVYIATPHAFHAEQAEAALLAGVDVFLEKPMVTTVDEARRLQKAAAKEKATLVVAFQGGLSDIVNKTKTEIAAKTYGELLSISGMIWEDWATSYRGNWKQVPHISGGGFMFDTGAHMLNTITVLTGTMVERLSAFQSNRGYDVDIVTVVAGRLKNGVFITMNGAGECAMPCDSHLSLFFTEAIIRIDAWGRWREIENANGEVIREEGEMLESPLQVFRDVCAGRCENPSSIDNGLRFASLWDAIKDSAALDGVPVNID